MEEQIQWLDISHGQERHDRSKVIGNNVVEMTAK